MRRLRENHTRGIGADMARDAGQHVGLGMGMGGFDVQLARGQGNRLIAGEGKGRTAQLDRIDPQQQVVHHRVADEGEL